MSDDKLSIDKEVSEFIGVFAGRKPADPIALFTNSDPEQLEFLRRPAGKSALLDQKVVDLLMQKAASMGNIAGLHARQIGHMNNVFVMVANKVMTPFIDVQDVVYSGKVLYGREQCFSELDERGKMITYLVPRPEFVRLTTADGQSYAFNGFESRVCQHELDHGNGILCMDKEGVKDLSPAKKAAIPGRNDPCMCGSGLKYKKCCLENCGG